MESADIGSGESDGLSDFRLQFALGAIEIFRGCGDCVDGHSSAIKLRRKA